MSLTRDQMTVIINTLFAELEAATQQKPWLHILVGLVHALALQLVPVITTKVKI